MQPAFHHIVGEREIATPDIYSYQILNDYDGTHSKYLSEPNCDYGSQCLLWIDDKVPFGPYPVGEFPTIPTGPLVTRQNVKDYWEGVMGIVRDYSSLTNNEEFGVLTTDDGDARYYNKSRYKDELVYGGATQLHASLDDAIEDYRTQDGTPFVYVFAGYQEVVEWTYRGEPYTIYSIIPPYNIVIRTQALLGNGTACRFSTVQGAVILSDN